MRRQGVFLHSISYWSDVLRTLIGEREKMIVRYDPGDLSRIYLWAPDARNYDLSYADLRRPPISLWEHRLALKRLRERGRDQVDEDAIFTAIDRMRGIADQAITETKTLRRQRERQGRRPQAGRDQAHQTRSLGVRTAARERAAVHQRGGMAVTESLSPSSVCRAGAGRCARRGAHTAYPDGSLARLRTGGSHPVGA